MYCMGDLDSRYGRFEWFIVNLDMVYSINEYIEFDIIVIVLNCKILFYKAYY